MPPRQKMSPRKPAGMRNGVKVSGIRLMVALQPARVSYCVAAKNGPDNATIVKKTNPIR